MPPDPARPRVALVVASIGRAGGGVSEAVRLQARLLVEAGLAVEVLTLREASFEQDSAGWPAVPIRAFRTFGPRRFGFSPGLLWGLLRSRADLAHVHGLWMFQGLAVLLWSVLRRRPYVVSPHGMLEPWILARSPRLKQLVSVLYQDALLRRAAVLQALTDKERDDITRAGVRAPVRVAQNYVEAPAGPAATPDWLGPALAGRDVYLFLGRLHEKKGCLELIDAFAALARSNDAFRRRSALVLCGWADGLDLTERVAEARGTGCEVVLVGPRYAEEKRAALAAAAFFVLPSKSEGLPITALEAAAEGAPLLLTAACNLPEAFAAGAALEIGETQDGVRRGLAQAAALSPAERLRMGQAGRRLVAERFSPETARDALTAIYRAALDGVRIPKGEGAKGGLNGHSRRA